eukprot:TRINITY_DN26621_c0_g1_i1.p1 TRINITY_DN26621_c0_g1~~TRINITY_DN26621_c0_g1_i1.p1  ORF type:complete len:729 (+),score=105.29 TRINITY_DN26621_c0_g1_i1:42-2189(+)
MSDESRTSLTTFEAEDGEFADSSDLPSDASGCFPNRPKCKRFALGGTAVVAGIAIIAGTVAAARVNVSQTREDSECLGFQQCPEYPLPYSFGTWPEKYDYSGTFPDEFVWGLGTASYQIEGAYNEGGRGASIWDTFSGANTVGMPGGNCSYCCKLAPCPINEHMKDKGSTGNVAADSYHLYKTDIALMKSMGLKHYRFSIAWPRMFPTGASVGDPNPEAVAWYSRFLDELLAAGIAPYVTLFHWDLPQALLSPPEAGGWWARDAKGQPSGQILPNWKHYVDTCFRLFGDRVKMWITFNEAWTFTFLASGFGKAPSIKQYGNQSIDPYIAGHTVLLAHAAAVDIYRRKYQTNQRGQIGITNNCDWREPKTNFSSDVAAAERAVLFQLGWFSDPIFRGEGDYPPEMRALFGDRLPNFTAEERVLLDGSADFYGLNHYGTGWYASSVEPGADTSYGKLSEEGFPEAQSAWLYGAGWGLRKLLNWVNRRYHHPVIYVTEGGWSLAASSPEQGAMDLDRALYYANYTSEMLKAIREDGVNVRGYFAWSLLDNFEWEMGYKERFGTTFTDYNFGFDPNAPVPNTHVPTPGRQLRRRKESNCWLENVWTHNSLASPTNLTFCARASVFAGVYSVEKSGCKSVINVQQLGTAGSGTLYLPQPGHSHCDNTTDVSYPINLEFSAGTIVCTTCKASQGGSSYLQGFWSQGNSIEWGDGTRWIKAF